MAVTEATQELTVETAVTAVTVVTAVTAVTAATAVTAVTAVTVGQVLRALEGPVAIVSCLRDHGECAQASGCTLRKPARKL